EPLAQCLADALRGAALQLTDHHHRVHHPADVVHGPIAVELHGTRLGVDFHFADVTAIRPARRTHGARRLQRDALACLASCELEQPDTPVGADDVEDAVSILDVR